MSASTTDVDGTHYVLPDVSWYVLGVSRPPQVFLAAAQIMFPDQTYRVAGPDQRNEQARRREFLKGGLVRL